MGVLRVGDRVHVEVEGVVSQAGGIFPLVAVLVRLDKKHGGDTHWFNERDCVVLEPAATPGPGEGETK